MSVRTAADEHLDLAGEHIQSAIREISQVVVEQCTGWDDFTAEAKARFQSVFDDLLTLRRKLNRG